MQLENLKAISLKRLVGASKAPAHGSITWLAVVFGVCTAIKTGSGDKGDWKRFDGDFIARGLTGKGRDEKIVAARAPQLFAPGAAEDMLLADGVGDDGTFTQFALKVGITSDEKGRPEYVAEYVLKPTQTSPADDLVSKHGGEYFGAADQSKAAAAPAKGKK